VASISVHEPAKRPPSGGSEKAAGSIHSASAIAASSAATPASTHRCHGASRSPGGRRHGPRTASTLVVAPKAVNSATHA
jgi:hypothetical protein